MDSEKWIFRITPARIVLLLITLAGVALAIYRLAFGLGATTNLNDHWPWGLWIILDISAVALAGAGYSMAVLAHILHIKDFSTLARRGMLISLLLYVYVLFTLILEVGRWDNVYRPLISWGYHSPLFEVFVAITLYMIIQTFEFGEVVTEKVFKPLNKIIAVTLPVVFFLGALIPFGHQASLGAIYLVMPDKLNALWYSSNLPWFFLITSFYVGPAMVLLDTLWSKKAYDYKPDYKALVKLARVSGFIMLLYFVWRVVDVSRMGALSSAFAGDFIGNMFLLEMAAGLLIPVIICLSPMIKTTAGMVSFAVLSAAGIILNRFNVVYTGMFEALGGSYAPNYVEWIISIGLLTMVMLAYLYIVENFNIYSYATQKENGHVEEVFSPARIPNNTETVPTYSGK